jgi:hypothetical protein
VSFQHLHLTLVVNEEDDDPSDAEEARKVDQILEQERIKKLAAEESLDKGTIAAQPKHQRQLFRIQFNDKVLKVEQICFSIGGWKQCICPAF